jgi:hypothetical protein
MTGLRLAAQSRLLASIPGEWDRAGARLVLQRQSLESGVLIPAMCYLAVETPEQEDIIRRQQERIRGGALPPGQQQPVNMDEPSWVWGFAAALVCVLFAPLRHNRNKSKKPCIRWGLKKL